MPPAPGWIRHCSGANFNGNQGHKVAAMGSENNESRDVNIPGTGKIPKIAALSNNNFRERERHFGHVEITSEQR